MNALSRICLAATAASLVFVAGCGYHLARRGGTVPENVYTLAVPVFQNDTYEVGIEDLITDALIQEFQRNRWARIVPEERADAVLLGAIKGFVAVPIAFATADFAVEYRVRIKVKITLRDREGNVIWQDREVSYSEEYEVTPDIFISEANTRRAVARLAAELAEEVHDRIFDGF